MCFGIILSQGLGDLISFGSLSFWTPSPTPNAVSHTSTFSRSALAYSVFGGPPRVCVHMCVCLCAFVYVWFSVSLFSFPCNPLCLTSPPLVFLLECRGLFSPMVVFFPLSPYQSLSFSSLPELVGLYLFLLISFLIPLWSLFSFFSYLPTYLYFSFILFR